MNPRIWLALAIAAPLFGGGCGSQSTRREVPASEIRIVTRNFRLVEVTGSHIPVAVPIDPEIQVLPSMAPFHVITPEQIRQAGGPLR